MESEESRPGSSASNSTSSSSSAESNDLNNGSRSSSVRKSRSNSSSASSSRNNSPDSEQLKVPRSPVNGDDKDESILSTNENKSLRSISPDGETNGRDVRSRSLSQESNSSNSSHENENHRRNNRSSDQQRSVSRNQSISPTRQSNQKVSRRSSASSAASDDEEHLKADDISDNELGPDNADSLQEKPESVADSDKHKSDTLNMSHEDLSDVSDLDSAQVSPARDDEQEDGEEKEEVRILLSSLI